MQKKYLTGCMKMKKILKGFKRVVLLILLLIVAVGGFYTYHVYKSVKKVQQFSTIVSEELEVKGIPQYKNLALSIIYTETKGQEDDLMQSSESVHGNTGETLTTRESIRAGVDFLAQAIEEAKEEKTDIWTAVQAYNFGLGYIDYVASRGGKNTLDLANDYSKTVVAPSLGNSTGEEYTYRHPQAILYNGGHLYVNGGNLFYAKIVELNEKIVELFS
jgi:hypothetical protein